MTLRHVALVIADISGYTRFLRANRTSLLHASEVVSSLLESVIDGASHPLQLNKIEGDAVLLYAELGDDAQAGASDVLRQASSMFAAFHARARLLSGERAACPCDACRNILALRLKIVVHHGRVAFRRIRQFEEMTGEDVIVVHRLLKNTIAAEEYLLLTEAFHQLAGAAPEMTMQASAEYYDDLGPIATRVHFPRQLAAGTVGSDRAVPHATNR